MLVKRLGEQFGSKVVAAQCITYADADGDGVVSRAELTSFLRSQGLAVSRGSTLQRAGTKGSLLRGSSVE